MMIKYNIIFIMRKFRFLKNQKIQLILTLYFFICIFFYNIKKVFIIIILVEILCQKRNKIIQARE